MKNLELKYLTNKLFSLTYKILDVKKFDKLFNH